MVKGSTQLPLTFYGMRQLSYPLASCWPKHGTKSKQAGIIPLLRYHVAKWNLPSTPYPIVHTVGAKARYDTALELPLVELCAAIYDALWVLWSYYGEPGFLLSNILLIGLLRDVREACAIRMQMYFCDNLRLLQNFNSGKTQWCTTFNPV